MQNLHENEGVLMRLKGGLGNQIFQFVSGWIVSIINRKPYYVSEPDANPHLTLNQDYNDTIFKEFNHRPIKETPQVWNELTNYKYFPQGGFAPWDPRQIPAPVVMEGYFQFYPAIEPFETPIRNTLLQGLDNYVLQDPKWSEFDWSNTAFLHVRRGDYCAKSHIHILQTEDYYKNAYKMLIDLLNDIPKHLLIFSDDTDFITKETSLLSFPNAELVLTKNEIEAMKLMSMCKKGAICGNSTFSWWGAYLGVYAERNPVFVPQNWIGLCHEQPVSLHPKEWIVL